MDSQALRLVTRREGEDLLGYAPGSLRVVMREQVGRWPGPLACRLADRALLWDADALRAVVTGAPPARRRRRPGAAEQDGSLVCSECGRRYRSLGPHLSRAHAMSAAEYRAVHQLPATATLMATDTRDALSQARNTHPDRDVLIARMRDATPPVPVIAAASAVARPLTDPLLRVRQARRAGWDVAVQRSAATRAARRDARARTAGYTDWREAITSTTTAPIHEVTAALGCAKTTVKRWRAAYRQDDSAPSDAAH